MTRNSAVAAKFVHYAGDSKLTWEVVSMEDVPTPPQPQAGKYDVLYDSIRDLGLNELRAMKVAFASPRALRSARDRLRKLAKRDGLRMLHSHDAMRTTAWFWCVVASDDGVETRKK